MSERWTAIEAFTWVAFGEARPISANIEFPEKEWSRPWKCWPPCWLFNAFREIETGIPWHPQPADWPRPNVDRIRTHAQQIIEETGESARELAVALEGDIQRFKQNQDTFRRAHADIMKAIREGRLHVWARPAFGPGKPDLGAVHQRLDPVLFDGPREVSVFGTVDFVDANDAGFAFLRYSGPWFDDTRFDASRVQALWPRSKNKLPLSVLTAWMTKHGEAELARSKCKPKRESLLKDCVTEFRCRFQDAAAAHKELPKHLRRERGNRA